MNRHLLLLSIIFCFWGCASRGPRPLLPPNDDLFFKESTSRSSLENNSSLINEIESLLIGCKDSKDNYFSEVIIPQLENKKIGTGYFNLIAAICMQKSGALPKALFFYQLSYEQFKNNLAYQALILNNIGVMYATIGSYETALNYFKDSIKAYPRYISSKYNELLISLMLGIVDKEKLKIFSDAITKGDAELQFISSYSQLLASDCKTIATVSKDHLYFDEINSLQLICEYMNTKSKRFRPEKITSSRHHEFNKLREQITTEMRLSDEQKN